MIIWIASYPKSGNTWVRTIISSIFFSDNGNFEMDLLEKIPQFPRNSHFHGITDDVSNINIIYKHWVKAQEKLNKENKIFFLKTHNANIKINGYPFTNKKNTLGTIYIVRDPRSLVSSIANHFKYSQIQAKNFILEKKALKQSLDGKSGVITPITDWGDHYKSWTENNESLLIIKYEDLLKNTKNEIVRIYSFLGKFIKVEFDDEKVDKIIKTTSFERLKYQEKLGKFKEYLKRDKDFKFFFKGPNNIWQNSLGEEIKKEIEKKYYNLMKKLNYI
tara:strand:+ start:29 stop:853 length:825 start_codon:yes stop_codon:yes gene_type:complete